MKEEGILSGSSSGTLLAGAINWCKKQTEPKKVVTLICDTGNKYLSKVFNDSWLQDNDLLDKLISESFESKKSISSSRTSFTNCCPGVTESKTLEPKGFSLTLGVGIFTTLFSVYFIARLLTVLYVAKNKQKEGLI